MALLIDTNQNAYPSAVNPDGSAAFPISVTGLGVAAATATSAAPTYVNGTTNPLSLDLAGNLRVTGGGGGGGGAVTAVSGAFVDGSIVTIGTEADAAWSGSGSGTVISVLKKIASAGGSAVSIADGSDVAQGTTTDPAWSGSGSSTLVAALKAIYAKVAGTLAVSGTFWQATQPVSAASLPLPALAATSTLQSTINTTLGSPMQQSGGSLSVTNFPATQPVSIASMPSTPVTGTFWQATQPVSGTFWQATQPISAVALPLPANAAQETGGNLAIVATAATSIAAGTPLARGQTSMAGSQSVAIAGDQPTPSGDRVRGFLLAEQLLFAMSAPTNGFVPMEVPAFLAGM